MQASGDGVSVHALIDFLQRNLLFTRYGFYPGFTDLLWAAILSDPRSVSDIWLISVLVKLASIGVSDSHHVANVEQLVDKNIDRYVNTTLAKIAMLQCALSPENPKHRELILRRLRSMNPENNPQVQDIRI
jgi:hypothetical protein